MQRHSSDVGPDHSTVTHGDTRARAPSLSLLVAYLKLTELFRPNPCTTPLPIHWTAFPSSAFPTPFPKYRHCALFRIIRSPACTAQLRHRLLYFVLSTYSLSTLFLDYVLHILLAPDPRFAALTCLVPSSQTRCSHHSRTASLRGMLSPTSPPSRRACFSASTSLPSERLMNFPQPWVLRVTTVPGRYACNLVHHVH